MANLIATYNGSNRVSLTPSTSAQTKTMSCSGKMMSTNIVITNAYDANLVSSNILRGKSIFGVSGDTSTVKTNHTYVNGVAKVGDKWCTTASWRSTSLGDYGSYYELNISSWGLSVLTGYVAVGFRCGLNRPSGAGYGNHCNYGYSRYIPLDNLTFSTTAIDLYSGSMDDAASASTFTCHVRGWGY